MMVLDTASRDNTLHDLTDQLSIILGFADPLLEDFAAADPKHHDADRIRRAVRAVIARLPELAPRSSGQAAR